MTGICIYILDYLLLLLLLLLFFLSLFFTSMFIFSFFCLYILYLSVVCSSIPPSFFPFFALSHDFLFFFLYLDRSPFLPQPFFSIHSWSHHFLCHYKHLNLHFLFFIGSDVKQYINFILQQLIILINRPHTPKTLQEHTGYYCSYCIVLVTSIIGFNPSLTKEKKWTSSDNINSFSSRGGDKKWGKNYYLKDIM